MEQYWLTIHMRFIFQNLLVQFPFLKFNFFERNVELGSRRYSCHCQLATQSLTSHLKMPIISMQCAAIHGKSSRLRRELIL